MTFLASGFWPRCAHPSFRLLNTQNGALRSSRAALRSCATLYAKIPVREKIIEVLQHLLVQQSNFRWHCESERFSAKAKAENYPFKTSLSCLSPSNPFISSPGQFDCHGANQKSSVPRRQTESTSLLLCYLMPMTLTSDNETAMSQPLPVTITLQRIPTATERSRVNNTMMHRGR